jgi:elongation factor P
MTMKVLVDEIRKNGIIREEGQVYLVLERRGPVPAGPSFLRLRVRNLRTKEETWLPFRDPVSIEVPDLPRRPVVYLGREDTGPVFMDLENYEQYRFCEQDTDAHLYLTPGLEAEIEFFEDTPVVIHLTSQVPLKVCQIEPVPSAGAKWREARLETGLHVRVPPDVEAGDTIRIDTRTGEYLGR